LEAERRQVTVLFADMVGFTTFSERSGRKPIPNDQKVFIEQKSFQPRRAVLTIVRVPSKFLRRRGAPRKV
jgi:hypothetical protein